MAQATMFCLVRQDLVRRDLVRRDLLHRDLVHRGRRSRMGALLRIMQIIHHQKKQTTRLRARWWCTRDMTRILCSWSQSGLV